jgi:hypothetical protein
MDATALIATLQDAMPEAQLEAVPSVDLQTTAYVSRVALPDVARLLRDREDLAFTVLAELTAADSGRTSRASKSSTSSCRSPAASGCASRSACTATMRTWRR